MLRSIILLRGVNVGGHNKLLMAEFRDALIAAGFAGVRTYIQSGNVVMCSPLSPGQISVGVMQVLASSFDINVPVFTLPASKLARFVDGNPFAGEASRILLYFCFDPLEGFDPSTLEDFARADEQLLITPDVIYLNAPSGIGRSKLAAKIDHLVPVQLTARNLRTTKKLVEMATVT